MLKHRDCMQLEVKFATLKSDKLLWRLMKKLHQNSLISSSFCPGRSLIQHERTHWWMRDFTHCKTMKEVTKAKQQRQLGWISLTDNYVWIKPPNLINEGCSIHRTFGVLVTWLQEMSLRWGGRGQHFIKMLAVLCFLCAFLFFGEC